MPSPVPETVHDFTAALSDGGTVRLDAWRGRVLLIVNTASRCGFTPQYEGLESLYRAHRDAGLTVLGFPCNQFGAQEPGDDAQIRDFCADTYGVSFPLFAKIDVKGPAAHPLFRYLCRARPGILGTRAIKWNFTKFLIGRDGVPVSRHAPRTGPETLDAPIRTLLAAPCWKPDLNS